MVAPFVVLVAILALVATATPAHAETLEPWWHLSSGLRPASLKAGSARNEVQELIATKGTFAGKKVAGFAVTIPVEPSGNIAVGEFASEPVAAELGLQAATAENLRAALETADPKTYGKGTLEVGGGEAGTEPLVVTTLAHNAPRLHVEAFTPEFGTAEATVISAGRPDGQIVATFANLGDAPANGCVPVAPGTGRYNSETCSEEASPPGSGEWEKNAINLADTLPAGLRAVSVQARLERSGATLKCTIPTPRSVTCEDLGAVTPYQQIELVIGVVVEHEASGGGIEDENRLSASGGGAPPASLARPVSEGGGEAGFGIEDYEVAPEDEGGQLDAKAGSHPFQTTFTVTLDQALTENVTGFFNGEPEPFEPALPKDVNVKLPPGLVGNPTAIPHCALAQFLAEKCGADTIVGVAMVTINESARQLPLAEVSVHVYNLEPNVGEPARLGFIPAEVPVFLDTTLRTGGDYGITTNVDNITQTTAFLSNKVMIWGVPGAAAHDGFRAGGGSEECIHGGCAPQEPQQNPPPFFTLPASCPGHPLASEIEADSWAAPGHFQSFPATTPLPALDGCNRVQFNAQVKVAPDGQAASSPSGLNVDVHVPQEGQLNAEGLAQSNVKDITVTLPEGVTLNPSAADGLEACSEHLAGYEGSSESPTEPGVSNPAFTPYLPGSIAAKAAVAAGKAPASEGALQPGVNFCANASKVAEASIKTPLLPHPLKGFVYLASPQNFHVFPQENPFETHVAMYIVAEDEESGSLVKLPGKVELGGAPGVEGLAPGQIRSTFEDNPQLPFEDAELHFFGGERAPLATPSRCGTYTTNATFTPWAGGEPIHGSSQFQISSGPHGGPCPPAALPANPSLASGMTNNNAGSFSDLTTTLSRPDGNQNIQSVTLHYPPGVSGMLKGVPLCGEAQANAGTCGQESRIGETIVSVGLGGDPFTVTGGKVYLTEKYQGAPFGLSIVNPAKAGPFDLQEGRPVVVRAKVEIDPVTAALTVTTGNIPTIVEGFPLQIQHVNVLVNRPGFTFNPTNCNPMTLTGSIAGDEGASSPVSVPFQVTNCAVLKYTPTLAVSTAGKASKANGASLHFKIAYPKGAMGSQSWMKFMKFDIPKQLPARLTTIQKACLAATFEHNRGACPSASVIGHVLVHTPVLPVPLEGPLYFVSYGGAAFPDAVAVLHGYGLTIESHGHTFINGKTGVTSATFESVPDVPFESIEVTVPQGPFSEFGANLPAKAKDNFCGQKLVMPIRFKAQNGLEITQNTPVGVTGCGKAKTRAQLLAAALKACHKDKNKAKRKRCEATARKRYGPPAKKANKNGRSKK